MLNYTVAAENGSMYNTPPCWPIYVCGLVFQHLLKLGGLDGEWGSKGRSVLVLLLLPMCCAAAPTSSKHDLRGLPVVAAISTAVQLAHLAGRRVFGVTGCLQWRGCSHTEEADSSALPVYCQPAAARERNVKKASLLYDTISASNGFYFSPVEESVRSKMNVPFTIPSKPELEKTFVAEATAAKLTELKGHRSVGGMRASIYNAMPYEGVEKLCNFMKEFQAKNA